MTTLALNLHIPAPHKLPRRYAPILFSFLMSTAIVAVTSGMITAINTGVGAGYGERWARSYALAWTFAFPTVAVVGPRVRRLVERFTAG